MQPCLVLCLFLYRERQEQEAGLGAMEFLVPR